MAWAQFNKSDIADLKAALLNYAESGCTNDQYRASATKIIGRLNAPIANTMTPEQAKSNDQLREALSGIQEGMVAALIGDKSTCPLKIRKGVKRLGTLPIQGKPSESSTEEKGDQSDAAP